jgi:hypothetical protein
MRMLTLVFIIVGGLMPTVLWANTDPPEQPKELALRTNPRLTSAKHAKDCIEETERDLARQEQEAFQLIERAIKQIPSGALDAQQDSLEGFRQVTGVLRQLSSELLANRTKIVTDIDKLCQVNKSAVDAFREAAITFEKYSKEESYAELHEEYLRLAGVWELLAVTLEKRASQYESGNQELKDMLEYLEHVSLFLDRLNQHFESLPNIVILKDRERYDNQLKQFIKSFERLRIMFHEFDDKLRENALADDLRSKKRNDEPAKTLGPAATGITQPNKAGGPVASSQKPVTDLAGNDSNGKLWFTVAGVPLAFGCFIFHRVISDSKC